MRPLGEETGRDRSSWGRHLAKLLAAGLICAVLMLLAGVVLAMLGRGNVGLHASSFTAIPGFLARGEAAGFIDLGLLVLLAVPLLRVISLLVAFLRSREWPFAVASLVIVMVLATGVVVGLTA
jgi:uncharacterized membrane protein